ncbi:nucleoporin subcomplex protein binding to Pom34-domain-containing protein [Parasitella parasitica]|nr:nucleoporin subcomplex protein binding to Pom34-domain-containing protein [Parasitella parasitica]
MAQSEPNEKFAGTYRKLFDTIERGSEQCSTDRLQTLLEEKKDQFKLGLEAFSEPSAQARSKITSLTAGTSLAVDGKSIKLGQNEKDLVLKLSEILKLNELQCALVWDTYKQASKIDVGETTETPLCEDIQLMMNVINCYFEDRLSLLGCISSLKRIAIDQGHPYTSIANDTVNKLHQDENNNTYIEQLFSQYAKLIRSNAPSRAQLFNGWSLIWAKQNLKEQRALLEIIFLFTLTEPATPTLIFSIIQEFEADCFGYYQAFSYVLDEEGIQLRQKVIHICMLLSANIIVPSYLTVGTKLEASIAEQSLLNSPDYIVKINQIACFMGDRPEQSVFLMAWSFFLTCVDSIINDEDATAPASYIQLISPILEGKQMISPTFLIDRPLSSSSVCADTNSRVILINQSAHLDRIYLGRSLKLSVFTVIIGALESEICSEEDVNNAGYRSVLRTLLNSFLSVTRPNYIPIDSYTTLINCYHLIYKNQPALCNAFWTKDFDSENAFSLLATARSRFPVFFTDFLQLLSALTGAPTESSSDSDGTSAKNVFDYLCNIPAMTVIMSPDVNITASDENNEVVIYADRAIRVTEELDSIASITIPEGSRGLLLNKAEDERVVQYAWQYSGWHLLTSVLAGFVTNISSKSTDVLDGEKILAGKNVDAIVSVLELFHSVLISNPKLAPTLVQHIDTVASQGSTTSVFISLLCSIVSTSSTTKPCPIPVLTLATKCMTLLIPFYRNDIWAYLKNTPILPTTNTSFHTGLSSYSTKVATNAQIQEIVSKVECPAGEYTLLLAFLDLVQCLVQDVQRCWWVNEHPQDKYRIEILYVCLHYLMSDVFPSYSQWRYKKVAERYLIGIKVLNIFTDVVNGFKEPCSSSSDKLSLNGIREGIFSNFLYDGVAYHISPLVDVIGEGARIADTFYNLGLPKEAERVEKLTEMTFIFVKTLLQHRLEQIEQGIPLADTTLERLLLERTPNSTSSDFLLRVARHINYRHNISLPIQATNVLTLLCRTTSAWKTAPNFVQYLGSTAQAHVIIRTYLSIAKDQFQNQVLLTCIWQLLTVLMETQPTLAILFLDCGDFIMPSPKSAVRVLPGQPQPASTTPQSPQSTESAIRAATDILGFWETLSVEKPTVVSNVLHFLATFWQTAFDHYALVERARVDNTLWDGLGKVLLNPTADIDATSREVQSLDLLDTENSEARHDTNVRRICCLNLSKAYVMRIIAYEIHLSAGNIQSQASAVADKLPVGLKHLLSKISESSKLVSMRDSIVKNDFNPSIVREVETSAKALLETIGAQSVNALLLKVPRVGSGDEGAPGEMRQYGDSFLYDYRMASNRVYTLYKDIVSKYDFINQENLIITPEIQAVLSLKQYANGFLQTLLLVNYNSSIVDSQIILLRAFKSFIETASRRATDLLWANKTGTSGSDSLYSFLKGLVENAQNETRDDGVTLTSYSILVHFIRSLTEDWIGKNSDTVTGNNIAAQKVYSSKTFEILSGLCNLVNRENYALSNSIRGYTAISFHRPLLETIKLSVRTLRGTMCHFTPLSFEHMQFQNCYTTLLTVICSSFSVLSTKAISYSAEGSLASEEQIENCIKDVTVVISQLQELINAKYSMPQDIWIDAFEEHQTIPLLLSLLYSGIEVLVKEVESQCQNLNSAHNISITPYAETVLYFLLALSNIPKAAKKLVKHNIFGLLSNNKLTPCWQQGKLDMYIRFGDGSKNGPNYAERNPLHSIWCQTLGVINNLMCHVGSEEMVLHCTVNLMQMYGPQIGTAFNNANGANDTFLGLSASESLSTPLLEEIDRINMLFFRVSQHLDRLPNIATNLFVSYKNCSLFLLQRYLYFYTHPSHMQAQLYPTDNIERQQAQTFLTSKSTTASSSEHEEGVKPQISELMQKTIKFTLNITHHMLTTLVALTDTDVILTRPDVDWPFGNAIIYPDMRVTNGESSSFGTLIAFMNVCILMLGQWQDIKGSPHKQLLDVIQDCAVLLTTQAVLWIAKPDIKDETRNEIAQEIILDITEVLSKSIASLTKLETALKDQKIKDKINIISYLQQVLGKRFFTE